jgi:hypothetical protein
MNTDAWRKNAQRNPTYGRKYLIKATYGVYLSSLHISTAPTIITTL